MVTPKLAARTGQKNPSSLEQRGAEGAAKVRETVDSQCRHSEPVDLQHGVQRGQFQFAKFQHGIDWGSSGRLGHSGKRFSPGGHDGTVCSSGPGHFQYRSGLEVG